MQGGVQGIQGCLGGVEGVPGGSRGGREVFGREKHEKRNGSGYPLSVPGVGRLKLASVQHADQGWRIYRNSEPPLRSPGSTEQAIKENPWV